MAMAHLKIDNEKKFAFEKNDELLLFTVTKQGDSLNDEFGLTAGVVERVDKRGKITSLSVIPHSSKEKLFDNPEAPKVMIPVNTLDVKFDEWFACSTGVFQGRVLPLYKVANSQFYILIKNVLRPVGKM
jgi:hypothetical protein